MLSWLSRLLAAADARTLLELLAPIEAPQAQALVTELQALCERLDSHLRSGGRHGVASHLGRALPQEDNGCDCGGSGGCGGDGGDCADRACCAPQADHHHHHQQQCCQAHTCLQQSAKQGPTEDLASLTKELQPLLLRCASWFDTRPIASLLA